MAISLGSEIDQLDKLKDILLRFVSSELTSHASNLVGLSIILFAYLDVATRLFPRPLKPETCNWVLSCFSYIMIFLIFWIVNSGIIFTLMRLVFYGHIADKIINYDKDVKTLEKLWNDIGKNGKEEEQIIPLKWFRSGIARLSRGLIFSFIVGFAVTFLLFLVFFV